MRGAQVVELMVDPFGNYLVQKLLDCCTEEQRLRILQAVAEPRLAGVNSAVAPEHGGAAAAEALVGLPQLVGVALNTHGTRAAQKLVETLHTAQQASHATAGRCN